MHHSPGTALITGASSGIGRAMAEQLARGGHPLVLVARRKQRLEELAERWRRKFSIPISVIACDLADPGAPRQILSALETDDLEVDILVNNAGYGVAGSFLSSSWEVHAAFLQVMVTAVAELTYLLGGSMKQRGRGQIINIASLAGLVPPSSGGHTLYAAVKSWMIRFSEALAFELDPHGISVTAVCPGFTYSEFHDLTGMRDKVSKLPAYMWMNADEVAKLSLAAARNGRSVCVTGRMNRFLLWLSRHLPRFLFQRLAARQSRHFRNSR